jgi:hypothetical protein
MAIYTTYYGNLKNVPFNNKVYSISRYTPRNIKDIETIKELTPSDSLLRRIKNKEITNLEYTNEFNEQLSRLDPYKFKEQLDGCVLVCYERPGSFCHRHLVSKWFRDHSISSFELPIDATDTRIQYVSHFDIKTLDAAGDKELFLFGDNMIRKGKAGQAIIRDHEKAIGVATKRLPSMKDDAFFSDQDDEIDCVIDDLLKVLDKIGEGYTINMPVMGIGTGLAQLDFRAPRIRNIIDIFIFTNSKVQDVRNRSAYFLKAIEEHR